MNPKRPSGKTLYFPALPCAPSALKPPTATPRNANRKRWWFAAAAIALPAVLLAIVEGALRLAGYGYPTSFLLHSRENGQQVLIENPRFGWRFFPPSVARTPQPISAPLQKPPGALRVLMLGESAAMGDPDPSYGLSRQLETILRQRHPDREIEVINAAMTAINSHVIREIARDCRRLNADYWVVYAGNNEVVGPFGAGTVFGSQAPGLGVVRLNLALKKLRLGQLLAGLLTPKTEPGEWEGMEAFLRHEVPRADPRLVHVYANFTRNLADVVRLGQRSGAKVILGTVAVNLQDCPPFASRHREGLAPQQQATWQTNFDAGFKAANRGRFSEALQACQQAMQIDPDFAELVFLEARCKAAEKHSQAKQEFELARDLDTLRFRADSRLNDIIRQVAATQGTPLVDVEAACSRNATNAVPGNAFFYDHVHFNFPGNFLAAKLLASEIDKPHPGQGLASNRAALTEEQLAEQLAFTPFDCRRVAEEMRLRLRQPPFSSQSNFQPRDEYWGEVLAQPTPPLPAQVAVYERALANATNDWVLHNNFGRLLEEAGEPARAATEWQTVARLLPHFPDAWMRLGHLAHDLGKYTEAEAYFQEALRRRPDSVDTLNELGLLAATQGGLTQALRFYRRALDLRPGYNAARVNLALTLSKAGDTVGAASQYREVLRRDTNNVPARVDLGILLSHAGRNDEAMALYEEALRLRPGEPSAHYNLARLLTARERFTEAESHFQAALRADPKSAETHLELGLVLARLGKYAEAMAQFEAATRLKPNLPDAHFNYGIALAKTRRFHEAVKEFEATLKLQPQHPQAAQALERASKAIAADEGRR